MLAFFAVFVAVGGEPGPLVSLFATAEPEQAWDELKALALACTKCRLSENRTQVVFGSGSPDAELMFVG